MSWPGGAKRGEMKQTVTQYQKRSVSSIDYTSQAPLLEGGGFARDPVDNIPLDQISYAISANRKKAFS